MKKKAIVFLAFAAALTAVSCQKEAMKEAETTPTGEGMTISAVSEGIGVAAKAGFTVNVNGKEQSGWRTLSTAEWQYLFNTRSSSKVGETENARYAKATVNGKAGIILLPDTYDHPTGVTALTYINQVSPGFKINIYDLAAWNKMEAAGAVFLPAAGYRDRSNVRKAGDDSGDYWSSTAYDSNNAYDVRFSSSDGIPDNDSFRQLGYSVRLITESKSLL